LRLSFCGAGSDGLRLVANTTNQPDMKPHARIVPGLRLPSAEVVGFKGERHKTFVSVPDTFRCPTLTAQLSR
jgi:hypothetical protein